MNETGNMAEKKVIVVVLNYKRPQETVECIYSIQQSSYTNIDIIIVDNDSQDDSVNRIQSVFPNIKIIISEKNTGYAGGMNIGLRYAMQFHTEYVMVINSDTIVQKDCVEALVSSMDQERNAAAASGTIYQYPNQGKVWFGGGELSLWRSTALINKKLTYTNNEKIQIVTFLSGCAILFRTSILKKIGLFNERFFMYLEDTELCIRFRRQGCRLLYVKEATFFHRTNVSEVTPFTIYFNLRNRLFIQEQNPKWISRFLGFSYLCSVFIAKMFLWMFINPIFTKAALYAFRDYSSGNAYEGRGLQFIGK